MADSLKLTLFFTRGQSLHKWHTIGLFERELSLYQKLQKRNVEITFVTYGGAEDLGYVEQLSNIKVLCNHWGLPKRLYALLLPLLHYRQLRSVDLFKTNQIHGADVALLAKFIHRKPLIVRAGYMWPRDHEREVGKSWRTRIMHWVASRVLHRAQRIVFTTQGMKAFASNRYGVLPEKITIIPNFVDTARFHPQPTAEKISGRVCAIGRLHPRKNLDLLIHALADVPNSHLVLIGEGPAKKQLAELANNLNVQVEFKGALPNAALPLEIAQSAVVAQVSQFEGHPKALIEAMGCGAAVIGTDVEGINNIIVNGYNGRLCKPTADSISNVLNELLGDSVTCQRLGEQATQFVQENYALEHIVKQELQVYQSVLEQTA
jgi:glycosyltransferase involved in cell wall biosynthesis